MESECRFKNYCAYSHIESRQDQEKKELKQKVKIPEKTINDFNNKIDDKKLEQTKKVLHALTRKVLSLKDEIKVIKNKKETNKEENNEKKYHNRKFLQH